MQHDISLQALQMCLNKLCWADWTGPSCLKSRQRFWGPPWAMYNDEEWFWVSSVITPTPFSFISKCNLAIRLTCWTIVTWYVTPWNYITSPLKFQVFMQLEDWIVPQVNVWLSSAKFFSELNCALQFLIHIVLIKIMILHFASEKFKFSPLKQPAPWDGNTYSSKERIYSWGKYSPSLVFP